MKKHIGSTIALVVGVLAILTGITQMKQGVAGNMLVSGPMIVLGALAYRSAKKRLLGQVKPATLRRLLEGAALVVIVLMVAMHNDLKDAIATDPTTFVLVPVWALVAYALVGFRSPAAGSAQATAPTSSP